MSCDIAIAISAVMPRYWLNIAPESLPLAMSVSHNNGANSAHAINIMPGRRSDMIVPQSAQKINTDCSFVDLFEVLQFEFMNNTLT